MMSPDDEYAFAYAAAYRIILLIFSIIIPLTYSKTNKFTNTTFGKILALAIILCFAFRPISRKFGFGDTEGYAFYFNFKKNHIDSQMFSDIGYETLTILLHNFDVVVLFGIMAILYVIPQLIASKKISPTNYGALFFIIVCSFSFWGYGVNGIRNGVAMSLVMLGMVLRHKITTPILFLLAWSFHGSALLPITAYGLTFIHKKPKSYIIGWLICFVLSIFVSNFLTSVLNIGNFVEDGRVNYLSGSFDSADQDRFSSVGYRWDFVLYGAIPIIIGAYQILKKNFKDKLYIALYNSYLTCNAFWLFTIYIPYNNRFAYLSWFLYPVIITYPFLKTAQRDTNSPVLKRTMFLNYLFTFMMWLI